MLDFGFYNMDCMDGMREFPDKYFDLAIVDPPYGIKADKGTGGFGTSTPRHYTSEWDDSIPSKEYFAELMRVSKNQIIWGGAIHDRAFATRNKMACVGQSRRRQV